MARDKTDTGDAYKAAGVDISKAEQALGLMRPHIASTQNQYSLYEEGSFAGAIDIGKVIKHFDMKAPILTLTIDGAGTVTIAARMAMEQVPHQDGREWCDSPWKYYHIIGYNLAAHACADTACRKAIPIAIVDNIDSTDVDLFVHEQLVAGMATCCREFNPSVVIVGGETAQMPGLIVDGQVGVVVAATGLAHLDRLARPKQQIKPGHVLVGIEANGLHLNGWSKVRQVMFDQVEDAQELQRRVERFLPKIIRKQPNYALIVVDQIERGTDLYVTGLAHITGGGLYDNIERLLPEGCRAVIRANTWARPVFYDALIDIAGVTLEQAHRMWNMGIGFVQIVDQREKADLERIESKFGLRSWIIGEIVEGERGVEIKFD